jgi:hypothetical protein
MKHPQNFPLSMNRVRKFKAWVPQFSTTVISKVIQSITYKGVLLLLKGARGFGEDWEGLAWAPPQYA